MKKLIAITLLSVTVVGCKGKYPQFVHNDCTGKWAVKTGFGRGYTDYEDLTNVFYGMYNTREVELYMGVRTVVLLRTWDHRETRIDTITDMAKGYESTFDTKGQAIDFYNAWVKINNRAVAAQQQAKIDQDNAKRIADSIFNCQHTYK